jgi:hypothetical protein
MKPRNFPGRKNARRKRALARAGTELQAHARILPDAMARAVRTKKDRTAFAKLGRNNA